MNKTDLELLSELLTKFSITYYPYGSGEGVEKNNLSFVSDLIEEELKEANSIK